MENTDVYPTVSSSAYLKGKISSAVIKHPLMDLGDVL